MRKRSSVLNHLRLSLGRPSLWLRHIHLPFLLLNPTMEREGRVGSAKCQSKDGSVSGLGPNIFIMDLDKDTRMAPKTERASAMAGPYILTSVPPFLLCLLPSLSSSIPQLPSLPGTIKMFRWMHHKFQNNMGYELLAQCKASFDDEAVALSSFRTLEGEAKALLVKDAVLMAESMLEESHDGFLAMGTASGLDEESGEPEADRDQPNKRRFRAPLASGFVYNYKHGESVDLVGASQAALGWADGDMDTVALLHHVVQFLMQEEGHREMSVERIRTTLAELFSRRDSVYVGGEMQDGGATKETVCPPRPGSDEAAEPVGPKGGETEPSSRLHRVQLTSKMSKRKIHPEMERRQEDLKDRTVVRGEEGDERVQFAHDYGDVKMKTSTARSEYQRSRRTVGWAKISSI